MDSIAPFSGEALPGKMVCQTEVVAPSADSTCLSNVVSDDETFLAGRGGFQPKGGFPGVVALALLMVASIARSPGIADRFYGGGSSREVAERVWAVPGTLALLWLAHSTCGWGFSPPSISVIVSVVGMTLAMAGKSCGALHRHRRNSVSV